MVASQLLQSSKNPPPATRDGVIIEDTRTPPKIKNQANKNKAKIVSTTVKPAPVVESSYIGVASPITPEELEKELSATKNKSSSLHKESSTTNEGISTWILLSGQSTTTKSPQAVQKNQAKMSDNENKEDKKTEDISPSKENKQKPKPTPKPIRQPPTIASKPMFTRRPIAIGSPNKADLIASGSAVNENVMNKIKASVLASVQKNKNAALNKTSTTTTTARPTLTTTTQKNDVKEIVNITFEPEINSPPKANEIKPITESSSKKKDSKNKDENESLQKANTEKSIIKATTALVESKEAEIELEVSTPKPKRTSSKKKKNKNRRRTKKPASTTIKPEVTVSAESKIDTNSTKQLATTKVPQKEKPITTQIYNYLSREVMPSVGVGLVSLAGLVGLASYFLYPFSNVVRRAYNENDRKDDLYYQNGESYATDDGGQSEEEMLGKVLAGIPTDSVNDRNINPYIGQTQFSYPQTKPQEQNVRYRNVAYGSDVNSFVSSDRLGQQSNDQMQGAAYSEQIHYDTHSSDQQDGFSPYQQPQPIYKSPESVILESSYPSEVSQSGYSTREKISEPMYGQAYGYGQDVSDSTNNPEIETLHLGADDIIEKQKETGYTVAVVGMDDKQPQFVVGNVPKEFIQSATPVTVPEHGPRSLRIRRAAIEAIHGRSIADSLEKVLIDARKNVTDPELSNEIDEALGLPVMKKQILEQKVSIVNAIPASSIRPHGDSSSVHSTVSNVIVSKDSSMSDVKDTKIDAVIKDDNIAISTTVSPTTKSKDLKNPSTQSDNVVSINEIGSFLTTRKYSPPIIDSKVVSHEKDSSAKIDAVNKNKENNLMPSIEFLPSLNEIRPSGPEDKLMSSIKMMDESIKEVDVKPSSPKPANIFIEVSTPSEDVEMMTIRDIEMTTPREIETTDAPYPDPDPDTYPDVDPLENHPKPFSFVSFIKKLFDFKMRLGFSILQSTTESIARYLRGVETSLRSFAKASDQDEFLDADV